MSDLNRWLIVGVSGVIGLLGGPQAAQIFTDKSPACLAALEKRAADISSACPNLDTAGLISMLGIGVVAFIILNFGRDIWQYFFSQDSR